MMNKKKLTKNILYMVLVATLTYSLIRLYDYIN